MDDLPFCHLISFRSFAAFRDVFDLILAIEVHDDAAVLCTYMLCSVCGFSRLDRWQTPRQSLLLLRSHFPTGTNQFRLLSVGYSLCYVVDLYFPAVCFSLICLIVSNSFFH